MEYLVVDSGAIIRGYGLELYGRAKTIVTVSEVMAEIRDSKSREILAKLPFPIEERVPSQESIKKVFDFARKTGDYAALSKTDLKLIALTFMLSCETNEKFIGNNNVLSLQEQMKKNNSETEEKKIVEQNPPRSFAWKNNPPVCASSNRSYRDATVPEKNINIPQTTPAIETEEVINDSTTITARIEQLSVTDATADSNIIIDMEDFPSLPVREKIYDSHDPSLDVEEKAFCIGDVEVEVDFDNNGLDERKESESGDEGEDGSEEDSEDINDDDDGEESEEDEEQNDSDGEESIVPLVDSTPVATPAIPSNLPSSTSNILRGGGGSWSAEASLRAAQEDDGRGWVGPANFKRHLLGAGGALGGKVGVTTEPVPASESTVASQDASNVNDTTTTTTTNKKKKNKKKKGIAGKDAVRVGCMTTDFSMQNVLMQLGCRVVSIDGMVVRSVRQWVLRCMACLQVHYDMDRLFCSRCGVNHMSRVAASISSGGPDGKAGELKLHLRRTARPAPQGLQYPLPAPGKQGRYSGEILLREDQLLTGIWRQKSVKIKKDVISAFGEDVTSAVGLHVNKSDVIRVGLQGARNPNAMKGRERRGQKKRVKGK